MAASDALSEALKHVVVKLYACDCVIYFVLLVSPAVVVFICLQDCEVSSGKRPCNGLEYQSSVNVPWNAPYHLSDSTAQHVRHAIFCSPYVFHG